jgi:hypothetical protein
MFKLPAVLFAVFMGFFMSLTLTICLSFYMMGLNNSLLTKFFQLWPIAYPIAIISIIIYRQLSLWIAGKVLTKLSSKNSKE